MVSRTQDWGGLVRQSVLGMEQGLSGRNGYLVGEGERGKGGAIGPDWGVGSGGEHSTDYVVV